MRVLEVIEANKATEGKAKHYCVNEVGALGVLKDLLEGGSYCGCRQWGEGRVVVKMLTNRSNRATVWKESDSKATRDWHSAVFRLCG